ncbi:hypothetical protein I3843_01G248500 [Carya illinoinensis]|nr:hypothetical protein I3843_01G248500 [Carya illinoinensis]
MEARTVLRFSFLSISLVLLFTFVHLPYAPPRMTDLLDCATNSPWCTSKNRIQTKKTNLLKEPPNRKRHHNHASDTPHHPLDPLTIQELKKVRSILSSHELFASSSYSLHSIDLEEPEKPLVLKWKKGDPLLPRKASVVARVVVRETGLHSGYPTMTMEDMTLSTFAPLANADFNRTIVQRGIDLADLACLPISTGWYGTSEENRRLIKVQCYSMEGTANFYMRPIEGLTVLVDLDTKQQPKGPSVKIEDEHLVKWANWEFHLKPDARAGVIVFWARVLDPDTGKLRDVMCKGFSFELFVPYMDPPMHGISRLIWMRANTGSGCKPCRSNRLTIVHWNAHYMDGVFAAGDGTPYIRSNMICVFESYAGDIGWRHSESPITGMDIREVRPKVTLVVRMVASVANYDYIVDWEFQTDGLIRVKVCHNSS